MLRNKELLRLDFGVFALHAMLTANFLVVPGLLRGTLGVSVHDQWIVYLLVLLVSVAVMVPAIIVGREVSPHEGRIRRVRLPRWSVSRSCSISAPAIYLSCSAALVVFFSAFNVMEASLPSLITKAAPPDAKGTAMGLYSSAQFLGIFVGGVVGGWAHQHGGNAAVFALTAAIALFWLLVAATMAQPSYLTTRLVRSPTAGPATPRASPPSCGKCRAWPRPW